MKQNQKMFCLKCGHSQLASTDCDDLLCLSCGHNYKYEDGVLDFSMDESLVTNLENIDYDAIGGIDEKVITAIGKQWSQLFHRSKIDLRGKSVLEIGSGTGALTVGLLESTHLKEIFATDISKKFLAKVSHRIKPEYVSKIVLVSCDCNNLPFQENSFDLIVGRSILHHLIDYDRVLKQAQLVLTKNGSAIFFEPILEGKLIVAFFTEVILGLLSIEKREDFSLREINLMKSTVRNITKASWYPQDRNSLLNIEDKYIFTLKKMTELGKSVGFSSVKILQPPIDIDCSYWAYFIATMRLLNISPIKFERYRFVSEAFLKTYGSFPDMLTMPMAYFRFIK